MPFEKLIAVISAVSVAVKMPVEKPPKLQVNVFEANVATTGGVGIETNHHLLVAQQCLLLSVE
jgi:hypothetical protein